MELRDYLERTPSLLLQERKVRGLLNDVFQNDVAKVNVMMSAYQIGIIETVRKSYPVTDLEESRLQRNLVQQFAMQPDRASWAVHSWVTAISPAVLRGIDTAEKQANKEKQEAEKEWKKKTQEPVRIEKDIIRIRDDYDQLHINPIFQAEEDKIFIPCGVGNTDSGFYIHGINKNILCEHRSADIYAIVYNYLIRSTNITKGDIPRYIRELDTPYELNYREIFRTAIIVLQMIRHNIIRGSLLTVNIKKPEQRECLKHALNLINHYSDLFSRLSRQKVEHLQAKVSDKGHIISMDNKIGIYVTNYSGKASIAREIWYGRKINYKLSVDNRDDLEYILGEISPFDSFKDGQLDALCSMLNNKEHAVCIMPTGSGKSLIYYMASILQPLPLFVVAPTEILIEDQIRNLKKFHHIDNASHLMLSHDNAFKNYELCNSLNYVTPMTLRNRNLHVIFRFLNNGTKMLGMREERIAPGPMLSYVVLDEIHCLSYWGHDFRPEYLMLSGFLKKYIDQVNLWGFTATANYTVVEDVQKQLDIPEENFFSPIGFDKYNITYDYRAHHSTEEMYESLSDIISTLINRGQRTLIFTKNDDISRKAAEIVGYEADIFSEDQPEAYHQFADGKCKVLIASDGLGIGINLPNVRNVIHFGLPLSKSEYVQEIGRAGRGNEQVTSYVLYLENEENNVPEAFLRRDTKIAEIPNIIENVDNDYGDVYRRLTNNCSTRESMLDRLQEVYRVLAKEIKGEAVRSFDFEGLEENKQMLYMLYAAGYIHNWYTYGINKDGSSVDIMIDVCSTGYHEYLNEPKKMFRRMQSKLCEYFDLIGDSRVWIARVNRADSIETLLSIYIDWYYEKYLFRHNEMFLDLFDMINGERGQNDAITEMIKDYFVLPFVKLKSDEAHYGNMTLKEIGNKVIEGFDKESLSRIERINSNRYSTNLDYLLFCGSLRYFDRLDESRLDRILGKVNSDEQEYIRDGFAKLYKYCGIKGKLAMLKYASQKNNRLKIKSEQFLEAAYSDADRDMIYYAIMAKKVNQSMNSMRRA